jgi:hypothetical protein
LLQKEAETQEIERRGEKATRAAILPMETGSIA